MKIKLIRPFLVNFSRPRGYKIGCYNCRHFSKESGIHSGASWTEGQNEIFRFGGFWWKIYFFSKVFFWIIDWPSKWHTGITYSISQKNCTLIWKIQGKPLKIEVFSNFEVTNDEKVFFILAEIKPWKITFPLVPLVLW